MERLSTAPRRRTLVLAVIFALLMQAGVGVAAAQSSEGPTGTVVVDEGETVDSIDTLANTIVVRGTVTGDLTGVASTVHVTETGRVGGDVEAAAATIRIDGTVDGDVNAAGANVAVSETATIGGNLDVGASYARIDGTVGGDVQAGADTLELGPSAEVDGEFRYDAGTFDRSPEAVVAGGVVQDSSIRGASGPPIEPFAIPNWVGVVYGLFANLLLGVLLLAVFPDFSAGVATRVADQPLRSGGVGLLTLVAVPLVLVLLAVTIIGIPLSLLGAVGFGLMAWAGSVYGQYAIGVWALDRVDRGNRWLALGVGIVGFTLLGAVPFVGWLFDLVAFLLGLGAFTLALRTSYRNRGQDETSGGRQTTLDESGADTPTA